MITYSIFIKASQLIFSLSLLVVLHELGHFLPAKFFKIKVEKFFLFFDAKFALFKKKVGDTVYGIGWIPLGGYVKIAGMIDESMDKEQLASPAQPWEFRSKPAWKRLIVIIGGVVVNFLLGYLIFICTTFYYGKDVVTNQSLIHGLSVDPLFQDIGFEDGDFILGLDDQPVENILEINTALLLRNIKKVRVLKSDDRIISINIPENIGVSMWKKNILTPFAPRMATILDSVKIGSVAQKIGLKKGDTIVSINNKPAVYWKEFQSLIKKNKNNTPFSIGIIKNGVVTYKKASLDSTDILGVYLNVNQIKETHVDFSFMESIPRGIKTGTTILKDYLAQFKYLFTKKGITHVGGIGSMGKLFPDTWNWEVLWKNTAFLSIMLAFLNILPIPALDGGHAIFILYEMIIRKKPNEKFLEYTQIAGMVILILLFVYANGNDVYKLLFN